MVQWFDQGDCPCVANHTQMITTDAVGNSGAFWIFSPQSIHLKSISKRMKTNKPLDFEKVQDTHNGSNRCVFGNPKVVHITTWEEPWWQVDSRFTIACH